VSWTSKQHASALKSFIDVTPKGKFNVIDMSVNGDGEWKKWNNASFWDANFVWTTLHDFGGTDGLKGTCNVSVLACAIVLACGIFLGCVILLACAILLGVLLVCVGLFVWGGTIVVLVGNLTSF
jgi:hypothetical protein